MTQHLFTNTLMCCRKKLRDCKKEVYVQENYTEELTQVRKCILRDSILWAWLKYSSTKLFFHLLMLTGLFSKMSPFLCFKICQAAIMKISMKKLPLKLCLAISSIWKKGIPYCHWIPISYQQLVAKGHVKNKCIVVSSLWEAHRTHL